MASKYALVTAPADSRMSAASFIACSRVAPPEWIRTWPMLRTSRAMVFAFRCSKQKATEPGASRRPAPQRSQGLLHILVLVTDQFHHLVVPRRVHEVVDRDVHRVRRLLPSAVGQLLLRDDQVGRSVQVRDGLVDHRDILDAGLLDL